MFFLNQAHFLLLYFVICMNIEATPLVLYVYMCTKSLFTYRLALSHTHQLIAVAGLQECYPYNITALYGNAVAHTCIRPALSHSLSTSWCLLTYRLPHTVLYNTPTDPLLCVLVNVAMHSYVPAICY